MDEPEKKETETKETEIDYSKLDPSKIPHHIVQATQAFGGLVAETQDLRTSVRDLQSANELLNSELKAKDEEEEGNGDQWVSQTKVKEMVENALEAEREKQRKDSEQNKQNEQNKKETISFNNLQEKYPVSEETGEGLDADTIIREGGAWLMQNKPNLFKAARQSDDPAGEIYQLAVAYVPSIKKRYQTKVNSDFLSTIHSGSIPKGTGALTPDTPEASAILQMIETPEDKLLDMIEKEELG